MKKPIKTPRRVADSGIDQAIVDWNNHNAYRSGSLRRLIDAKLVSWGHGGWAPTKAGRQRGLNPNHLEDELRVEAARRRGTPEVPGAGHGLEWHRYRDSLVGTVNGERRFLLDPTADGDWILWAVNPKTGVQTHKIGRFATSSDAQDAARRGGQTVREPRIVRDFDALEHLIGHAANELGATHVSGEGPTTKIFFPRAGQYPYEAASVRRKGGYWHADGPGAREGVKSLPRGAKPIGHVGRRAAETNKSARKQGEEYAFNQIESDHFRDWVYDQLVEASKLDPEDVLPLKTKADALVVAKNTLQQLEWDTKREVNRSPAFWEGFGHACDESREWLAEELLAMNREIRSGRVASPKAKRSTSRKPST